MFLEETVDCSDPPSLIHATHISDFFQNEEDEADPDNEDEE